MTRRTMHPGTPTGTAPPPAAGAGRAKLRRQWRRGLTGDRVSFVVMTIAEDPTGAYLPDVLEGLAPDVWDAVAKPGHEATVALGATLAGPSARVSAVDRVGRAFDPGAWALDRVYVGDITHVRTHEGWLYLATAIDLASRRVVGFAMADHLRASLVRDALAMAIELRRPAPGLILHSDRGASTPRGSSGRSWRPTAPSSRSRDPVSAGTMPPPRASSRRSRRGGGTQARLRRHGQPVRRTGARPPDSVTCRRSCTSQMNVRL